MLKRELIRIGAAGALGAILGVIMSISYGNAVWMLMPVYVVGTFYAGRLIFQGLKGSFKNYISGQMLCLWSHPILGTIISILFLGLSVAVVLMIGWLVGIGKCIYSVLKAVQEDRRIRASL